MEKTPTNAAINFNASDFDPVKKVALSFPDTEEGISHEGTPSVTVRGKLMCRLHHEGTFIPIRLDIPTRDKYLDSHPELFHLPEHFKPYPYVCMELQDQYDVKLLTEVLELSWKGLATKKRVKEYEERK